jgi:hypothetical protein
VNWSAHIRVARQFIPEPSRVIMLMMAGVTLVLFIACSNVANLQLARASARFADISPSGARCRRPRIITLLTGARLLSLIAVPLGIHCGGRHA